MARLLQSQHTRRGQEARGSSIDLLRLGAQVTAGATALAVVVLALGPEATKLEELHDNRPVTHQPTGAIAKAIQATITTRPIDVQCLPKVRDTYSGSTKNLDGLTSEPSAGHYDIQLTNRVCRWVHQYAAQPNKGQTSDGERYHLLTVVHEAEHVRNGLVWSERETECAAFQELPEFLEYLGATNDQATRVQQEMIGTYRHDDGPHYKDLTCYDGGPQDLDPQHVGIFPYHHSPAQS